VSDAAASAKRVQEQAVAAWIDHLKQIRFENVLSALNRQDENLRNALDSINGALSQITEEVVGTNRGGEHGMHGFIAEVAEVGIGNARGAILGEDPSYRWVNDNGPVDLLRSGVRIQQKFVAAGGRLGLGAVAEHLQRYPDFVKNGGKYQLPRDQYELIRTLNETSAEDAGAFLVRSGEGPSYRDWKRVHSFFAEGSIDIEALEPAHLEYSQVQRGSYRETLEAEQQALGAVDQSMRDRARQENRPTATEAARATFMAAGVESATAFVLAVGKKRRSGKKLRDFTSEDWIDVARDSGVGFFEGGIRGVTIYSLTNLTATSAASANLMVTAAFGVAEQAHRLRRGDITEVEFLENAELVALEAGMSALSSLIGQALIPIPILGAVIGTTVGTVMHNTVSVALSNREAALLESYRDDQRALDEHLAGQHRDLLVDLDTSMLRYITLLERAWSPDVAVALAGSVELARDVGIVSEAILDTDEKIQSYFLD
jgi:hypothetical protein